ncbi:SagB family peptide dehydrogenase [Streptomyces sp. KR80]|uniref:SagB family peptide dehydrogenase n=1 Tax=Streptomyces sp. KR80 TaxID=3457426 RepID=UPI003FD0777B
MPETDAAQCVLEYVEAVHRRVRHPIEPPGFTPDWADRPSPHTFHPSAERIPLPYVDAEPAGAGGFGLPSLAHCLRLSAGVLSRRWEIDWNGDSGTRARLTGARWGRGTPSGGATYPLELYWATGPAGPLPPGVFHYASGLHALERLSWGDPSHAVCTALSMKNEEPDSSDQFLLCTLRFWKNSFKYHNLSYHLMTLDLGAFLGTWEMVCRERGIGCRGRLWFDEEPLNRLLGLDPQEESVVAVLPLPWRSGPRAVAGRSTPPARAARLPRYERSRRTRTFALAQAVHRAVSQSSRPVPQRRTGSPRPPSGEAVPLPRVRPVPPAGGVAAVLARRSSAGGRFNGARALSRTALGALLQDAVDGPRQGAEDPAETPGETPAQDAGEDPSDGEPRRLTRLTVVANRVRGLSPGVHAYDPDRHALTPVSGAVLLEQRHYAMSNYSVPHAAAVLVLDWRPAAAVAAFGPRAYRAAHAEAGAVAQRVHLAATARGLGCGIVLGMDAPAVDTALGLAAEGRRSQLYLLLGHLQEGTAALDDRLC